MPACDARSTVVFDPLLTGYDFGPDHPMSPVRVDLTVRLAEALGVRSVVRKRREIYLYHNVRIHLDEVCDLGRFLEQADC